MLTIPLRRLKPRALFCLVFCLMFGLVFGLVFGPMFGPMFGLPLTALLTAPVQAQTAPATSPARPDPLDPKAHVPAVRYEPSLTPVRRAGDDKPVAWRDANDAVARIGGWRAYAREAQQPDPAPSPTRAAAPAPAPAVTPPVTPPATPPATPAAQVHPAGHAGNQP